MKSIQTRYDFNDELTLIEMFSDTVTRLSKRSGCAYACTTFLRSQMD